jgi:DNA invertase Pin-like site-specific DNA recombinase
MKQEQRNGAVVYVRSATSEQENGTSNLGVQETLCRDYCSQRGWTVEAVFVEPVGTADRPELRRMLDYCKVHRKKVCHAVVRDLSRFGRNIAVLTQTVSEFERIGVLVRSTDESNIDDTAAGKLNAKIVDTFNQDFSESLSEKVRARTRQAVAAGRFPWPAPIGYQNIGGTEGPNIKPDDQRAPLVRRAFELIATGLRSKHEVLTVVTDEGLTTRGGKPLSVRTFDRVLKNPIYAGWVTLPSDTSVKPVRGLHEPIVSQETFHRVQVILDGKKPSSAPKRKINSEVPLNDPFRCGACGKRFIQAVCRGRGNTYIRFWCPNRECRSKARQGS